MRSSRLSRATLVALPNRSDAVPICNSARAPLSAQTRSPVISGRFGWANTQSSSPAGEKLTAPLICDRRAARPGGSASTVPQASEAAIAASAVNQAPRNLRDRVMVVLVILLVVVGPHYGHG
jgi:hypothetical protein